MPISRVYPMLLGVAAKTGIIRIDKGEKRLWDVPLS